MALVATGEDFDKTTNWQKEMMTKEGGGLHWSISHNSHFKVTKSTIMHLARKTIPDLDSDNG